MKSVKSNCSSWEGCNPKTRTLQWFFDHTALGETDQRLSTDLDTEWTYQWDSAQRLIRAERTAPQNRVAYPLMPIFELSFLASRSLTPDGLRTDASSALQTTWETYTYDTHGHRTRSNRSDSSSRIQVYSRTGQLLYVEDSRDNQRIDYIHLGGKLIAQRSRPLTTNAVTTTYHHTDHLGSANVETNAYGIQTQRTIRMPYGAPYTGLYREGPGYTGHVTDTHTNLTYMQQRYYDPVALRFLTPDPVDVNPTSGSNFNRYWYANNNPMRFVDPDGRFVQALWGVPIGAVIDVAAQKIANPDKPIDWISVGVSAVVGGVSGGVASVARVSAIRGTITVRQAIAATAVGNAAVGTAGSATDSAIHGETPSAEKMAVAAAANGGLSLAAGLSSAKGMLAEKMASASPNSPQGIGSHILRTSQSADGSAGTSAVQGTASLGGRVVEIGREAAVSAGQKKVEDQL